MLILLSRSLADPLPWRPLSLLRSAPGGQTLTARRSLPVYPNETDIYLSRSRCLKSAKALIAAR